MPDPADVRNIVVAQPILSGDPQLREALAANVQELRPARFVWLVDEGDAVAQSVAADIVEKCTKRGAKQWRTIRWRSRRYHVVDDTISGIVNPSHAVRGHPLRLYRQFPSNLSLLLPG